MQAWTKWELRGSVVVLEQASESLAALDGGVLIHRAHVRLDEHVAKSLMVALVVIVQDEFAERLTQVPLAPGNDSIQTLGLDRFDEILGASEQDALGGVATDLYAEVVESCGWRIPVRVEFTGLFSVPVQPHTR